MKTLIHNPYAANAIARYYHKQPVSSHRAVRKWNILIEESYKQTARILALPLYKNLTIQFETGQKYHDALTMCQDIDRGLLVISSDNTRHPVFSHEDTMVGRIWHDLAHHLALRDGSDFTYKGEVITYFEQLKHISQHPYYEDVKHALFVDVLGQAAFQTETGAFPVQKIF